MAAIIFLMVFFATGALLILITYLALVAEEAQCIAKLERAAAIRDVSMPNKLPDQRHDRVA